MLLRGLKSLPFVGQFGHFKMLLRGLKSLPFVGQFGHFKMLLRGLKSLPCVGQFPLMIKPDIRVLLLSESINNLTRLVQNALNWKKVNCRVVGTREIDAMVNSINEFKPDLIVCPYMTIKIPAFIYNNANRPCLIVHPGIAGDRGASSLDWAIIENEQEWGVTVLQASEEMDAGDIWSTTNFKVPENCTKTSLYTGCVSDAAVKCVLDAVSRFCQNVLPEPLSDHPEVRGLLRRNMTVSDRKVEWILSSEEITARVRMSDTRPGAIGLINNTVYRLFDAHLESGDLSREVRVMLNNAGPGEVVGQKNKSILVKGGDENGVWIGQLKKNSKSPAVKLPATLMLKKSHDSHSPDIQEPCSHDDIKVVTTGSVCYVYFDFYNGAMDEDQARRLEYTIQQADQMPDVKVVVLMGGERFFSTGIHLCVIENSPSKPIEAWSNINAIDDVIKTIVTMINKVSVAVLRGNAGAGGAMLAAACDVTVAHTGVLLTPSYKAMSLYGSEYWTYFLSRRVGHEKAQQLVRETTPISAQKAESIGLLDKVFLMNKEEMIMALPEYLHELQLTGKIDDVIRKKRTLRDSSWRCLIDQHRAFELSQMRKNFRSTEFLTAMHNFVYHKTDNAERK